MMRPVNLSRLPNHHCRARGTGGAAGRPGDGLMLVAFWLGTAVSGRPDPGKASQPASAEPEKVGIHTTDVMDAILSLNGDRLTQYLQAGWKVDWPLDAWGAPRWTGCRSCASEPLTTTRPAC